MARSGDKPKLLAIGIAPLGILSIGVVPMGVVSLGVVGMGVLNLCVVGMGVLVTGVNVMGVWWMGLDGMGPKRLGGAPGALHQHHAPSASPAADALLAYPTRQEALQRAKQLGCEGAHAMGSRWMPCAEHPR